MLYSRFYSTQSRDRTGMEVNPLVFETSASTNSAIWASPLKLCKGSNIFFIYQIIIVKIIILLINNSLCVVFIVVVTVEFMDLLSFTILMFQNLFDCIMIVVIFL